MQTNPLCGSGFNVQFYIGEERGQGKGKEGVKGEGKKEFLQTFHLTCNHSFKCVYGHQCVGSSSFELY